ncbi:hypothetical protein FOXYSP1_00044, partial [Fusarium oxysporum f. sp. phaseoli]
SKITTKNAAKLSFSLPGVYRVCGEDSYWVVYGVIPLSKLDAIHLGVKISKVRAIFSAFGLTLCFNSWFRVLWLEVESVREVSMKLSWEMSSQPGKLARPMSTRFFLTLKPWRVVR